MRKIFYSNLAALQSALLLIVLGAASCVRQAQDPLTDGGYAYYPLEIGKYILYDVDSTYWDDFLREEIPVRCQMRYECVDTFRDGENRLSYIVNVYRRPGAAHPFVIDNVIHVTPTSRSIEFNQKNVTLIPFAFPVSASTKWDGLAKVNRDDVRENAYKSRKWDFHYLDLNATYYNGVLNFDKTVTVSQIDEQINDPDVDSTAYSEKIYGKEIYAEHVGLVYKEFIYWEFMPKSPGSPATGFRKGKAVVMKAVDHN